MNILVKLPSRERPDRLRTSILAMRERQKMFCSYLFTVDDDDETVEHYWLHQVGVVKTGPRSTKVEAINRDLANFDAGSPNGAKWDILVLASDDMVCQVQDWDEIIRQDMASNFPDTDGCLWYFDGHQKNLCTMAIMGRKAFDRLGYIYHPSYESLWCDKEYTEYWQSQGKLVKSERVLFTHPHPAWGTAKMDKLYAHNNMADRKDMLNYERRKAEGFPA